MNTFSFVLLLASAASCCASGVPTFSWLQSPEPVLKITYPNGQSDIAILKSFNPIPVQSFERQEDVDTCIYDGYLANESDVYVTLTGCAHTDTFNASCCNFLSDQKLICIFILADPIQKPALGALHVLSC
jgi:hypothetical protein